MVVDPNRAPFAEIDHWQYVRGTPAGYGLNEAAHYLRTQLEQSENIIVVYDEHPSTLPATLQFHLRDQQQHITHIVVPFWRMDADYFGPHLAVQPAPVFVVVSDPSDAGLQFNFDSWPYLDRVAHFERPGGLSSINIYRGVQ